MALGDWIQLLSHRSLPNGTRSTNSRPLPSNVSGINVRIDCTTLDPLNPFTGFSPSFSNPSMTITFRTHFSWDGGATFPENAASSINGVATGIWGTFHGVNNMAPAFSRGVPFNSVLGGRPTHYQADLTLSGGPVDFGISFREF